MDTTECVTVVVPVYNVEKYLKESLYSVINQSYRNLDIILVDDGSTDSSGSICDSFASQDSRIRVVHKENGGLSEARNTAIQIAKGRYITFIDSDDIVSKNMIDYLWRTIKSDGSDISICNFSCFSKKLPSSCNKEEYNKPEYMSGVAGIKLMFYQIDSDVSASYKLYRTVLFDEIRYPKGLIFEDLATTYKLFLIANKVSYINVPLYYYRQREGSIRHSEFKKIDMCSLDIVQDIEKELKRSNTFNVLKKSFYARSLSVTFQVYMKDIPKNYAEYENELYKYIKYFRRIVIFDSKARKKTRIAAMLSFFGSGICRKVYNRLANA